MTCAWLQTAFCNKLVVCLFFRARCVRSGFIPPRLFAELQYAVYSTLYQSTANSCLRLQLVLCAAVKNVAHNRTTKVGLVSVAFSDKAIHVDDAVWRPNYPCRGLVLSHNFRWITGPHPPKLAQPAKEPTTAEMAEREHQPYYNFCLSRRILSLP